MIKISLFRFFKRRKKQNPAEEPTREEIAIKVLKYIYKELKVLSEPYEVQYELTEDFVRWNLPEDFGSDWTEVFEVSFKPYLEDIPNITEEEISLLLNIMNNFKEAFKLEDDEYNIVWLHESMKNHPFWEDQRNLAKQAICLFEKNHPCLNEPPV